MSDTCHWPTSIINNTENAHKRFQLNQLSFDYRLSPKFPPPLRCSLTHYLHVFFYCDDSFSSLLFFVCVCGSFYIDRDHFPASPSPQFFWCISLCISLCLLPPSIYCWFFKCIFIYNLFIYIYIYLYLCKRMVVSSNTVPKSDTGKRLNFQTMNLNFNVVFNATTIYSDTPLRSYWILSVFFYQFAVL